MKYAGTLLAVADMERSKRFYQEVLGLSVAADFGANVMLEGGVFLQTLETWLTFIRSDEIVFRHHAGELYFEETDMDAFLNRLEKLEIEYVHPVIEHSWGQRAVRFYDPDRHIIEVGEDMTMVVRRFWNGGMTAEQIALRMDVPLDYVEARLAGE
ncbi:MAG: VOC family protein [Firmicutes bacterium]|nr:VOC family protein [Bacillota bacterium]